MALSYILTSCKQGKKTIHLNLDHEFGTIDLLVNSSFETRGIDSFSLALIKAERQMRRLFTFLIFQNTSFQHKDVMVLRKVLFENKKVYFEDFIKGINLIMTKPLQDIYGVNYSDDLASIKDYIQIRNKIFHGQLTDKRLSRKDLIEFVEKIKNWCSNVSLCMENEIGYDGFGRNSYQKSSNKLSLRSLDKFDTIDKYKAFLKHISSR